MTRMESSRRAGGSLFRPAEWGLSSGAEERLPRGVGGSLSRRTE